MGATFTEKPRTGILLASIIALQNLPEGFNACRELTATKAFKFQRILIYFCLLALLGPMLGLAGYGWLYAYPELVASIMLFGAGGILYLIFQDIAPQVPLDNQWAPPFGAVVGFLLGVIGHMVIH
jgi:ZIP family zinc transporter